MFTLVVLYIFFYLLIFISILAITISHIPLIILTNLSMNNFIIFIQKFKTYKNVYLWLFFILTGLPPVGLFFVKFNILFVIFSNAHIFSSFIIFFFFLFNMLFYCQIFFFKNYKKSLYSIINPTIFTNLINNQESYCNFSNYTTYYVLLFVMNILMFVTFSFIFVGDYYLIIYCLSVNNKSKNFLYF